MRPLQDSQAGFLLPAAIFLLVVLAGLGAYAVNLMSVQQQTGTQDIQSARVYHRARGIMEYGIYQILTNTNFPFDTCPSITNLSVNNLDGLNTSTINLTCTVQDFTEEGGDKMLSVSSLQSKVSTGILNQPNYMERQIDLTVSRCVDSNGIACL